MATKRKLTINDVTFENSIDTSVNQPNSAPSSSSSPARTLKMPQWRALKWALKFASGSSSEPPKLKEVEKKYEEPEVHYHECFGEVHKLSLLLSQLERKSKELTSYLESEESVRRGGETTMMLTQQIAAAAAPLQLEKDIEEVSEGDGSEPALQPESVKTYQEYVNMFVSLFLHSNFISFAGGVSKDSDPLCIVSTLVNKNCPDVPLFRRVCVSPKYVANQMPDAYNESTFRSIPVNQLARFIDVAILQYLSSATEHTSRESVVWCLEYLYNLLELLHASLSKLNSYGWYGAPPLRTRKGTTMGRPSITYPPIGSPFAAPPVVVVETPPTSPSHTVSTTPSPEPPTFNAFRGNSPFLDPETGQRSPSVPLPPREAVSPPSRRERGSYPPTSVVSEPLFHRGGVASPPGGVAPKGRQRRISRDEHHRILPTFEPPQRFHYSQSWDGPHAPPSHAMPSSPPSLGSPEHLLIPLSQASPSRQSMQSIPEEDVAPPTGPNSPSPEPGSPVKSKPITVEVEYHGSSPAPSSLPRSPAMSNSSQLGIIEEVKEEPKDNSTSIVVPEVRSPSPGLSGVLSTGSSLSSLGDEEEVRSKPTISTTPPGPKEVPRVNVQMELETLMNGEGRVSLLAVLNAISKLPQTLELWQEDLGEKCFAIIQLCMDLGLRTSLGEDTLPKVAPPSSSTSSQEKRRQFKSQKNSAFHELGGGSEEKPSKVHSQYVVEFSVRALIHCATSLIVGCTSEPFSCRVRHNHLPDQSISTYNTLTRLLKRVYTFSPRCYRQALSDFAKPSGSSCRRLFQFLHIMLQYCTPPDGRLDVFMMSTVSAVLRETIDRLTQLDITETSIQNSIVSEACSFFEYAHQLFSSEQISSNKRFRHLHMYIHRIALSVILPRPEDRKQPRPLTTIAEASTEAPTSPNDSREKCSPPSTDRVGEDTPTKMASSSGRPGSKKLLKQATFALGLTGASSANSQEKVRHRTGSLDLPASSSSSTNAAAEGKGGASSSGKSRRAQWTKQQNIHSDPPNAVSGANSGRSSNGTVVGGVTVDAISGEKVWRGLKLDLMRSRIQRLIIVMNTSEPGSIPDAGMLASLVDLGGESSVVSRAMVFLECALFVNKLVSDGGYSSTVWMDQNKDNHHLMYNITNNLRRWGEAIAEKLKIVELKERDIKMRLSSGKSDEPLCLPEEPVFPEKQDNNGEPKLYISEDNSRTVSYAIKMAACVLLLEITRYLRNNQEQCVTQGTSISQAGTPRVSVTNIDRKVSTSSIVSSDMEMTRGGQTLSHPPRLGHFGSSLSVEDAETSPYETRHTFLAEDTGSGSSSPRKKRASVYLRVTSTGGASGTISRTTSIRRHSKIVRLGDGGGDHRGVQRSPTFTRQRKSAGTSTALHTSFYTGTRTRRPSIVPNATIGSYHPARYRRKSMGADVASREKEEGEFAHSQHIAPPISSSGKTSPGSSLGQKLRRSAQRAFRRNTRQGSRLLQSDQAVSPSSSPGLATRKRVHSGRRPSISGGSITQSIGPHPLPPEEARKHYPWLDVVEHIVLADSMNRDARELHAQACRSLMAALNMVYSSSCEEEAEQKDTQKKGKHAALKMTLTRSVSTLFSSFNLGEESLRGSTVSQVKGRTSQQTARSISLPSVRRRTLQRSNATIRQFSAPVSTSSTMTSPSLSASDALARFSFSNMSYAQFESSLFGATGLGGSDGEIETFLEEESSFSKPYLLAELDKQRREYVKNEFVGLLHSPLSVLIHAAPILHDSTFSVLMPAVWDLLLDSDPELAKTAAVFFLLTGAKETEKTMEVFVRERVMYGGQLVHSEAIQKFKVLWDSRYHVWPRMEDRAQKQFNVHGETEDKTREDQQTIGYSLPANLLGNQGSTPPYPPWEPASVCTNKLCESNPSKCYRQTHLAQIVHGPEISEKVQTFHVSGVSMPQEASSKPASIYLGFESDEQDGNIEYWEAVEPTLFPRSLFPLIRFVVMALSPKHSTKLPDHAPQSPHHHGNTSSFNITELARQVVWSCMVEDPRLFFRSLLNQFNKIVVDPNCKSSQVDHLLAETLQPLHVLLQAFNFLPPAAAHNLFNNFVGVIMRHTDQPSIHSHKIVQSVLTLITMVVPSVQGLDSKLLKGILKKESCYTTIMTTARIRGVERVYLLSDLSQFGPQLYQVTDDMTFGHLISEVSRMKYPISEWYLVDKNKGTDVPVLSSLVIQDEYSMPLDGHYPTFELCHVDSQMAAKLWNQQLEKLFVFKMSEAMRVHFMLQLLLTGPEVERGFSYSEYAQPNYRFIHNELVQLNSFPRKALTSILYEAGPGALQRFQLKVSDIMLKSIWVKFIVQLFKSIKPDFDWSNSIILFLNVINGALLLHSEDSTILKYCLASLLMAATKFSVIFKADGYLMIIPTLIQVYALHIRNELITGALKFIWSHFFLLDSYTFYLQVTAATATLVNGEAAFLARNLTSSFSGLSTGLPHMDDSEARKLLVRAVYELMASLDIDFPPADELGVRSCCLENLEEVDLQSKLNSERWTRLSLMNGANLCISLACWDPEQLRGMQVLVFLDNLMPKFLEVFGTLGYYKSMLNSMEYLIKGCSSISKLITNWKGNVLTTRKNAEKEATNQTDQSEDPAGNTVVPIQSDEEAAPSGRSQVVRKASVANAFHNLKLLVNPNKKDLSDRVSFAEEGVSYSRQRKLSATTPGAGVASLPKDFRSRRIQDAQQQIIRLSRDALLSLSTQFAMHYVNETQRERRRSSATSVKKQDRFLDTQSISYLTSIAVQLLKQGFFNDEVLQMKGLNLFMTHLLPSVEWTEQYFSSFNNILGRVVKLFKYLQRANRAMTAWDNLSGFLGGISSCIHKHPQLVQGQDQHLSKLRLLMETLVSMHSGGVAGQQPQQKKWYKSIQRPLLASAPSSFSDAIVGLAVELIVATHTQLQPKFRYYSEDILRLMPHKDIKTHEDQLLTKILLPLCIQLGLRADIDHLSKEDADYMVKLVDSKVKFLLKFPGQKFSAEQFFRTFKVICCTFGETFDVQDWHKVAQWVLSLARTQLVSPTKRTAGKKVSTTSITSNESSGRTRQSSVSSTASSTMAAKLENYISFHESLLGFYESFVVVYRVPVFSLLWSLLRQLEPQLLSTLQAVKSDNPAQFERVNLCIERFQRLEKTNYSVPTSKNKHQLLREIQEELKIVFQEEMSRTFSQLPHRPTLSRSNTSVDGGRPQRLSKRRLSTPYISPLTMIGEEDSNFDVGSATLPRHLEQRPKTLPVRARALTTGSAQLSRPAPSVKKASFVNEIELKPVARSKRSPSPRRSPVPHVKNNGQSSPVRSKSPVKGRAPKLGVLGKLGSSGFYADNEDDDLPEVEVHPSKVIIQLTKSDDDELDRNVVVPNAGAASAGNSPYSVKRETANRNQVTITAEVHENHSVGESPRLSTTPRVTFCEDSSSTPLLPSPKTSRNRKGVRKVRPVSPSRKTREYHKSREANGSTDGESDNFLTSTYEAETSAVDSLAKPASRENARKGLSLSLDRRNASGLRELKSAFDESSKYMYHSLEGVNDYSQC